MSTVQLIIVCVTVVVLACIAAAALLAVPARGGRDADAPQVRVGRRVTVHTKQPDDQTIFGLLVGDYTDRIVLEDAEFVTPLGGRPLPGTQHIATRDISWIDVHAHVAPAPEAVPAAATSGAGA